MHAVSPPINLSTQKKRVIVLVVTGTVIVIVTATSIIFATKANREIVHTLDPCAKEPLPTAAPETQRESVIALVSALVFTGNTLFANIYRTYENFYGLIFGGKSSAVQAYRVARYVKAHAEPPVCIVVPDDVMQKNVLDLMSSKAPGVNVQVILFSGDIPRGHVYIPYALTRLQKQAFPDEFQSISTWGDTISGALNLLPLFVTVTLSLLYIFHAYNELGASWGTAGYALGAVGAAIRLCFRFNRTLLAGNKIKDAFSEERFLVWLLKFIFPVAFIAYCAMPYGLYNASTLLTGAVDWLYKMTGSAEVCHLKKGATPIKWLGNVVFSLGAIDFFKSLLSNPKQVRDWFKVLRWVAILPVIIGAADTWFSGWYYPRFLLEKDQPNAEAYIDFVGLLYLVNYFLYYYLGNIADMASIATVMQAKPKNNSGVGFFDESSSLLPSAQGAVNAPAQALQEAKALVQPAKPSRYSPCAIM